MGVTVIKTKDRVPYRPLYYAFEEKYFSQSKDFVTGHVKSWSDSPFLFLNLTVDDEKKIGSYVTLFLTSEGTYRKLLAGAIKEHEIEPFKPGEYGCPYLYWPSLIVENRMHAPYLIKSVFGEVAECARKWELLITHVYSIAFTKVSERLARRYFFEKVGVYKEGAHEYAIMAAKVADNPYLRAFVPRV